MAENTLRKRNVAATGAEKNGDGVAAATPAAAPKGCVRKCLGWACYVTAVSVAVLAVGGFGLKHFYEEETNMFLMRFFRDLSRSKAHARLHGDASGLSVVNVLAGQEELLPLKDPEDDGMYMSPEQLKEFNGENGAPIYLAIMGRIYDVTRGKSFYAKGRSYHRYVGKDASRSFATGCAKEECLVSSLVGLTDYQRQEGKRWLELYEYHDKYKFIGTLRSDPVADLVEQELIEQETLEQAQKMEAEFDGATEEGRLAGARKMSDKAKGMYRDGNYEGALSYWTSGLVFLGEAAASNEVDVVLERADILVTMAAMVQKRQEYVEANEYYDEVKDGLEQALGAEAARAHPMFGRALSDQAAAFYAQGQADKAIEGFAAALKSYKTAISHGAKGVSEDDRERNSLRRIHAERANTQHNFAVVLMAGLTQGGKQVSNLDKGTVTTVRGLLTELVELYSDSDIDPRLHRIAASAEASLDHLEANYGDANHDKTPV